MAARRNLRELDPGEVVRAAYTKDALASLGARFGFDALANEHVKQLRAMAYAYAYAQCMEGEGEYLKREQAKYSRLSDTTNKFLRDLQTFDSEHLALELFWTARRMGEPMPQVVVPDLPPGLPPRGEPYHYELLRMLRLLGEAARTHAEALKSRGGRPKNLGLKTLTHRAADFWIEVLERRFSIDHRRGAGLTEAFAFVKALVAPLDDVTDAQIITAMRSEIRQRKEWDVPTAPRKKLP